MGQGYKAIILAAEPHKGKEVIRTWLDPHAHDNGYKLMEHSYIGNNFVEALEYLISPHGMFYKSRVVWCGDYADQEAGLEDNLYLISDDEPNAAKISRPARHDMTSYKYIINHTTRQYIDKETCVEVDGRKIHPLPLLTAEGNGRGGGDYKGSNEELVGTWARHVISVEKEIPDDYAEFICEFSE